MDAATIAPFGNRSKASIIPHWNQSSAMSCAQEGAFFAAWINRGPR
jgi:hypothetical protein